MIEHRCTQGSYEWQIARLGVVTASEVDKILTPSLKLSSQRMRYACRLAAERVIGRPVEEFGGTFWTERGLELESDVQEFYMLATGLAPRATGFIYRDETHTTGCSPDWLIDGDDGAPIYGVELKCPNAASHVENFIAGLCPRKHWLQVQYSIWVTGLPWQFVSFYPELPPALVDVEADDETQKAFDDNIPTFVEEVAAIEGRLRQ